MTAFDQAKIDDPRAFERFLRDQGFSRSRAKAITAKGFGGEVSLKQQDKSDVDWMVEYVLKARRRLAMPSQKRDGFSAAKVLEEVLSHGGKQIWDELAAHLKASIAREMVAKFGIEARTWRYDRNLSIRLRPGRQHKFILPFLSNRSGQRFFYFKASSQGEAQGAAEISFSATFQFLKWTTEGVKTDRVSFDGRRPSGFVSVGGTSEANAWAKQADLDDIIVLHNQMRRFREGGVISVRLDSSNSGEVLIEAGYK